MAERPRVVSVSTYRNWWWLIVACGIAAAMQAFRFGIASFAAPYLQLDAFLPVTLFLAVALVCFILPLRAKTYLLFDNRIEVWRGRRKLLETVLLKDISGWSEQWLRLQKSPDIWVLHVFHPKGRLRISSSRVTNYTSFHALRRGTKQAAAAVDPRDARLIAGIFFLLALVFLIPGSDYLFRPEKPHFVTLPAVLSDDPAMRNSGRNGSYLQLWIQGLDAFTVSISGARADVAAVQAVVEDLHRGDTVFLMIAADDYRAKILGREPLLFETKHYRYWHLDPYGLSTNEAIYLEADTAWGASQERRINNGKSFTLISAGVVAFGMLVLCMLLRRRAGVKPPVKSPAVKGSASGTT